MHIHRIYCALVLASALVSSSTKADETEDCVQSENPQLRVDACTAEIISGNWKEHEIGWAHNNRGIGYLMLGHYRNAIADFDRAAKLGNADAILYSNRGTAYWYLQEYERSLADQEHAIRLDPEYSLAFQGRGLVYDSLGQYQLAIADNLRAIELDPQNIRAIDNLGLVYGRIGETQKSIQFRERAMLQWGTWAIREWQIMLRDAGYYSGHINGVYDEVTRSAFHACGKVRCN